MKDSTETLLALLQEQLVQPASPLTIHTIIQVVVDIVSDFFMKEAFRAMQLIVMARNIIY